MRYILGLDLGGTKISCGVISERGEIQKEPFTIPTESDKPGKHIIKNVKRCIDKTLNIKPSIHISGIGIGSPGPLDSKKGIILSPGNLPTLRGCNLKKEIENAYSLPVQIDNDANCFVLGEAVFGAGKGFSIVTGLTLGTGLGCGIVIDSKIYRGATGTSAEIWKTPYLNGNFEDRVSGRGIEDAYIRRGGSLISPKEIARRARNGEEIAIESMEEFGYHLGIVISFMVNLLDPDVVVLGGSIQKDWPLFKETTLNTIVVNINPIPQKHLRVSPSKLGESAGIVGAASLFFGDL
jgi:glucokinase